MHTTPSADDIPIESTGITATELLLRALELGIRVSQLLTL